MYNIERKVDTVTMEFAEIVIDIKLTIKNKLAVIESSLRNIVATIKRLLIYKSAIYNM